MKRHSFALFAVAIAVCFYAQQITLAQGVLLRGVGAVNEGVGGTATGMPLDAAGALYWNPGAITALPKNEMTFGLGLFQPYSKVKSSVTYPAPINQSLSGSTSGETGVTPVPNMAFVWSTCKSSPFTYGLGMSAAGGASTLYPHVTPNKPNPVLMNHGRSANVVVLQVTPTVAAQVTERLSVGFAPITDLASLNVNPMSLNRDINSPLETYGTRYVWGLGFQTGVLYDFQNHVKAGFMFKSPVWAEKLYFAGTYYDGQGVAQPAKTNFHLNLPMTLSAGISYDGFHNTVIGMDIRYIDYANTPGLKKGLNDNGNVDGLGWKSVYAISVGAERKINSKVKARLGYCWNENPIPPSSAALCISAPMITQHVFSCGFGYTFAKDLEMSVAYGKGFKNKLTGSIPKESLQTPIPGVIGTGTVTNTVSADSLFMGLTKKW
jgi:long-chain fatty acid transport protein